MNIYIGNLADSVTEDMLKGLFEAYGNVDSVKVIKDRISGSSRGFGFITMESDISAQSAINGMNGIAVEGKNIKVALRHDNPPRRFEKRSYSGPRDNDYGGGSNGGGSRDYNSSRGGNGGGYRRG